MAASAVDDSCQVSIIRNGRLSDLGPAERGYFVGLDTKGEHLLSAYTLVRGSPFVAWSVVILVNIEKGARLRTNLIVGDGLL